MKIMNKLLSAACLLPVIAMAVPTTISDWGFEPDGELRVQVGEEVVFVSPEHQSQYFEALMAARMHWPVEVNQGELVIDTAAVPSEQLALLAYTCTDDDMNCTFTGVTKSKYSCMLPALQSMVETAGGTIYEWPSPAATSGRARFIVPGYSPIEFNLTFTYQNPLLNTSIVTAPKPYYVLWEMMDKVIAKCP